MKTELTHDNFCTKTQNGHNYQIVKENVRSTRVLGLAAALPFFGWESENKFSKDAQKKGPRAVWLFETK